MLRRVLESGFLKGLLRLRGDSKNLKVLSRVLCFSCVLLYVSSDPSQMCYVSNNNLNRRLIVPFDSMKKCRQNYKEPAL